MSNLYQNIKKYRLAKGLTQDQLAKILGYTNRSSIAKIEIGRSDLTPSKVEAFAKALDVTPGMLMGWDESDSDLKLYSLNSTESFVVDTMRTFNNKGVDKVVDYVTDISESSLYIKHDTDPKEAESLNA